MFIKVGGARSWSRRRSSPAGSLLAALTLLVIVGDAYAAADGDGACPRPSRRFPLRRALQLGRAVLVPGLGRDADRLGPGCAAAGVRAALHRAARVSSSCGRSACPATGCSACWSASAAWRCSSARSRAAACSVPSRSVLTGFCYAASSLAGGRYLREMPAATIAFGTMHAGGVGLASVRPGPAAVERARDGR